MSNFEKPYKMTCEEAQLLMVPMWAKMPGISKEEKMAFNVHVIVCSACSKEYAETKKLMSSVKQHWGPVSTETRQLIENAGYKVLEQKTDCAQPMIIKEYKKDLCRHRPDIADNSKKPGSFRLFPRISAAAACLVIGVLTWMVFSNHPKQQILSHNITSPRITSAPVTSVKVELVKSSGNIAIDASQIIVADNELKTLQINGNRQMVLNIGTELSIEAYNLGCLIKLDKGEIYTEVERDGKPFMVEAPYGRAVITGTTFNIKADRNRMDLAVVEGSVQFESEKGTVTVQGGYQSSITANMKPSIPVTCDAVQIAQWAKGQEANEITPVNQPDGYFSEMLDLPVTFIPYCDLEDIKYDRWIDQHREWFEREFPWTKRLQKLLAEDGIEVDTIDLLIESKDLWRFAWPEYSQHRILAEDKQVIQEVASQHGVEIDKLISADVIQYKQTPNIEAFEKWLNAFKSEESNLAISSIHTCVFLINMRSLAWYGVNDGHIQVENKQQVLDLLSEQVQIASNMLTTLNQLLLADKGKSVCLTAQYDEYISNIKDGISSMLENERELGKYEVVDE